MSRAPGYPSIYAKSLFQLGGKSIVGQFVFQGEVGMSGPPQCNFQGTW